MIFDPSKNSILQNSWSFETVNDLLSVCLLIRPHTVVMDCSDEFEPVPGFRHHSFRSFITFARENNVKVIMLLGSKNIETLPKHVQELVDHCTIKFFPTNFIATTTKPIIESVPVELRDVNSNTQFTQMYYCFVNRPHLWRCSFIDIVNKYKVNKIGKYTWNILTENYLGYKYNFEYWNEQIVSGNDGYCEPSNYHKPEDLYFDSFMEVVLESTLRVIFLTEKTIKPIAWGKPFIVYAAPGFHKFLVELGFQLYTEVFDYSFDSIEDDVERAEAIVNQINTLHNTRSYSDMYKQLKSKIEFNQKHLVQVHEDVAFKRISYVSEFVNDLKMYTNQMWNSLI